MPLDKSVGAALALTFFLGPLGLFYTSAAAAVVMILVSVSVSFLTVGAGLILTWPACMIWAAVDASRMHQNYQRWILNQQQVQPIIVQQQTAAPPPWYPPPPRQDSPPRPEPPARPVS